MKPLTIAALALVAATVPASAMTSEDYALQGRQLYSAFRCSFLASKLGDEKEGERLFLYGYDTGKSFLEAALADKIRKEDAEKQVPMAVMWNMAGPNNDFRLGTIWKEAVEDVSDDVYKTDDPNDTAELQKLRADKLFRDGNCALIGK